MKELQCNLKYYISLSAIVSVLFNAFFSLNVAVTDISMLCAFKYSHYYIIA